MLIRSVYQTILPEFTARPPAAWEERVREISPMTDRMDHLRFRWREPKPFWDYPVQGQWQLYACLPKALIPASEASVYAKHWTTLPTWEQEGRKAVVTDYQYFMWHEHGLHVRRFWTLQGEGGGTPAMYSARERRYLDGKGWLSTPFDLGTFPACPFDERSVSAILARDRLVKACNRFDELEKMDRPEAQKALDDAAEVLFRATYLETWSEMMQPQKEFLKSQIGQKALSADAPPAPDGLADALAQWKDHYITNGNVIGAKAASSRALQIAVK